MAGWSPGARRPRRRSVNAARGRPPPGTPRSPGGLRHGVEDALNAPEATVRPVAESMSVILCVSWQERAAHRLSGHCWCPLSSIGRPAAVSPVETRGSTRRTTGVTPQSACGDHVGAASQRGIPRLQRAGRDRTDRHRSLRYPVDPDETVQHRFLSSVSHKGAAMPRPYTAVGLIPTVWRHPHALRDPAEPGPHHPSDQGRRPGSPAWTCRCG